MNYYQIRKRKGLFDSISVNMFLILLNVLVFVVIFFLGFFRGPCYETICQFIALQPSSIFIGNYFWTFLTSMFMHANFTHLFVNMLSLLFVGSFIERILGQRRYLLFYLFSGLFSGVFFVLISKFLFTADFNVYAVGASGALFGLVGLLVLLTPNQPVYVMFIPIPIKMKYAGPGILAVLWLISIAGSVPIGNTAHLGGLVAGLIYGIYLKKKFPTKTKRISQIFS